MRTTTVAAMALTGTVGVRPAYANAATAAPAPTMTPDGGEK